MPEVQFVETDAGAIAGANVQTAAIMAGRDLYQGDPLRMLTLGLSYVQAVFAGKVNHAANQSFLDYAEGESLDALGALLAVTRRPAEAARCTLRFSLGAAREEITLIPQGTRATVAASGVYWATIESVEIAAGATYADVIAEATVAGPSANGYLVGEINALVDPVAFVATVANTSASSDGSEAEDDESMRERIREAPTRFSVAGPEDAYITLTKDSRADVDSVSINSPSPRVIDVYFTLTGGALPAAETVAEVLAYLSDRYRRPMSDVVQVHAPTATTYAVDITYYISNADAARSAEIQVAVTAAVADYVAWQRAQIGRDVNPSELVRRVQQAGALRVDVTAPAYAELDYAHLAVLDGDAVVTVGGLDDE
jgi:phage-related baseplate assembly protein